MSKVNVGDVCVDIEWSLKSVSCKSYVYVYSDCYVEPFDRYVVIGDAISTMMSAFRDLGVNSSELTVSVRSVYQQTSSGRSLL